MRHSQDNVYNPTANMQLFPCRFVRQRSPSFHKINIFAKSCLHVCFSKKPNKKKNKKKPDCGSRVQDWFHREKQFPPLPVFRAAKNSHGKCSPKILLASFRLTQPMNAECHKTSIDCSTLYFPILAIFLYQHHRCCVSLIICYLISREA